MSDNSTFKILDLQLFAVILQETYLLIPTTYYLATYIALQTGKK